MIDFGIFEFGFQDDRQQINNQLEIKMDFILTTAPIVNLIYLMSK
jgi:hypothetical protein